MAGVAPGMLSWYHEIPIISRCYLTAAVTITMACFLDLVSPLALYYNHDMIINKGQYWRLLSSFLFFGTFSLEFFFHMYFVVRYCRQLEEGPFRGRTADFVFMLLYGATLMLLCASTIDMFTKIKFLSHPLIFMMVYLWSRDPENHHIRMSFFGIITFSAPYFSWALLLFSLLLGNPVEMDLLGIIIGHTYYFLDSVYPQIAVARNWSIKKVLVTPSLLHYIFTADYGLLNTRVWEGPELVGQPLNLPARNDPHPHQA